MTASSTIKHGVGADDTLHAFNNPMSVHRNDEGFVIFVGSAVDATLVEVGYVVSDDSTPGIFPARKRYLR